MVTETKVYDEVITIRQYLEEQKQTIQDDFVEPAVVQNTQTLAPESPGIKAGEDGDDGFALSITYKNTDILTQLVISPMQRASMMEEMVKNFKIIIPKVVAKPVEFIPSKIYTKNQKDQAYERFLHQKLMQHKNVN